jgi:2'-5' RNA ligase
MVEGSAHPPDQTPIRTFVAIELPEEARIWIAGQQVHIAAALSEAGAGTAIRLVPAGNLHLTLRFLGDTTVAQCRRLAEDLSAAAREWQPLRLRLGGLGCFPNCRRPNVLWCGVAGDLAELTTIQATVERSVQHAGFAAETRPYAPHLTIGRTAKQASPARVKQAGQVVTRLAGVLPVAGPHFDVTQLVHMQSDLRPTGSVYTPLATIGFGQGA